MKSAGTTFKRGDLVTLYPRDGAPIRSEVIESVMGSDREYVTLGTGVEIGAPLSDAEAHRFVTTGRIAPPVDIRVIVPFHNAYPFVEQALRSVLNQEYDGYFDVSIVNDASDQEIIDAPPPRRAANLLQYLSGIEGPGAIVIETKRPWVIHYRYERGGELASILQATRNLEGGEDGMGALPLTDTTVICHVCGDDYLPDPHVLSRLAAVYADPDVWMTYGSYVYDNGEPGPCEALPPEAHEAGDYRDRPWVTSHLRSYRYGLWKRIPPEQLLDPATGAPWFYATDRAMMYPMLEMAREHARFIQDVMYVYRRHPGNVPPTADAGHCQRVANMPRLARLETIYGD